MIRKRNKTRPVLTAYFAPIPWCKGEELPPLAFRGIDSPVLAETSAPLPASCTSPEEDDGGEALLFPTRAAIGVDEEEALLKGLVLLETADTGGSIRW
jgi:hypothetical protein